MRKESVYVDESYADQYDEDRFGGTFGQYLHEHEVNTFLSLMKESNGNVLDVGAGTGKLSLPLIRQYGRVTCLDSSAEMLRIALGKAHREGLILRSVICDARHLCFHERAFDYAVSSRVLMHLADWRGSLSELCRVADCIIVDFPPLISFSGLHSLLSRCKNAFNLKSQPYQGFLIKRVARELQSHNFAVLAIKRGFFLPMAFHRWLDRPRFSLVVEQIFESVGLVNLLGAPVTLKAMRR